MEYFYEPPTDPKLLPGFTPGTAGSVTARTPEQVTCYFRNGMVIRTPPDDECGATGVMGAGETYSPSVQAWAVGIGRDGRCTCGADCACPLGKTGSAMRCTKEELDGVKNLAMIYVQTGASPDPAKDRPATDLEEENGTPPTSDDECDVPVVVQE